MAAPFVQRGWTLLGPPTSVLALRGDADAGVEHTLFITCRPGDAALTRVPLGCTLNVHYPALEACLHEALQRDPAEAGRQSLRLSLRALQVADAPGDEPEPYVVTLPDPPDAQALGERMLHDVEHHLEPLRQPLQHLAALRVGQPPPPTVDAWTWRLRQAARLILQATPAEIEPFLDTLARDAQAVLDRAEASAEHPGAAEARQLAQAWRRPPPA